MYLGTIALRDGWVFVIHRRHRYDLSRFQLGLRLLDYLLNHDLPFPKTFTRESKSVR